MARPVMELLDLLGRRWALRVVWELRGDTGLTFRELQAASGDLSSSVLTDRLRELTEAGVVTRDKSGYVLTARGRELLELLLPLDAWARKWAGRDGDPAESASGGGSVQRDDAAGEVAPLRALPAGLGDQVREPLLVGPGTDRLGEVDVGVR